MFHLNLVDYMVVLFGYHVLTSRNVSVSVLYPRLFAFSNTCGVFVSGLKHRACNFTQTQSIVGHGR